jgi:heme exporter protein A
MNSLRADQISKTYGNRQVLRNISCELHAGSITAIIGSNGSGKSTLAKILAGLLRPDSGSVQLRINGNNVDRELIPHSCGFVAPYLTLYDEFTPIELLRMNGALHGKHVDASMCEQLLDRVGLLTRGSSRVRTFSSGMRQRVALALALSHDPRLLILDEPSTTLDEQGRLILAREVERASSQGAIVIVATNDAREREFCSNIITVE